MSPRVIGSTRRDRFTVEPDDLVPSPLKPFDMPSQAALTAAGEKVVAHYFAANSELGGEVHANNDHYFDDCLPEGSIVEADGDSLIRDKPFDPWEEDRPRANEGGVDWKVLDKAWEVQQAIDAGIDGWFADWLNLNDGTGDDRTGSLKDMMEAILHLGVEDHFKCTLMLDAMASIGRSTNLSAVVSKIGEFITLYSDVMEWLPDGRLLMAVYNPAGAGTTVSGGSGTPAQVLAHFDAIGDQVLANYEVELAFWFCYQRGPWNDSDAGEGYGDTLDNCKYIYGHGRWGERTPSGVLAANSQNYLAAQVCHDDYGRPWLAPVAPEDERPRDNAYWESGNTEAMRNAFQSADQSGTARSKRIQLITWNDIPEHAHICPSMNHGYLWLDLVSYYLIHYKLGYWPTIIRDGILLSHRIHKSSGYVEQVTVPDQVRQTAEAARDDIEAVVFLTDIVNTTVRFTINGTPGTPIVPSSSNEADFGGPGLYIMTAPLPTNAAVGAIVVEVIRNSVVVATVSNTQAVSNTPIKQDMHYRGEVSLRQAA